MTDRKKQTAISSSVLKAGPLNKDFFFLIGDACQVGGFDITIFWGDMKRWTEEWQDCDISC